MCCVYVCVFFFLLQGDKSSLGDGMSTGRQDDFWGGDCPASPVTPSRETSGTAAGVHGHEKAGSPETPST